MKPVKQNFGEAAREVEPGRTFLMADTGTGLSYAELSSLASRLEALFDAAGLPADGIAAVVVPEGPLAVAAIVSTLSACVAAPVNPELPGPEMLTLLRRMRPGAVVVAATLLPELFPVLDELGLPVITVEGFPHIACELVETTLPAVPSRKAGERPRETGVLLPTSGTSGETKLVLLDQARLAHAAAGIASSLDLSEADRNLCVLPCFHIHGLSTVLATLLSGGSVVAVGRFSVDWCIPVLGSRRVTWLSATPAHLGSLVNALEGGMLPPGSTALRFLRSASSPLPEALREAVESAFSVPVVQAYGMTEAGPLIASNGLATDRRRAGSVGRPVGIEVNISPLDGLPAADGQPGEIAIRGPGVIRDYYPGSGGGARSCEPGWFHTGDLGFMDADGFLFVTGRGDEVINSGGEKIIPQQVEALLLEHPAVREAVVYPAPHPVLGEAPHAAVVLQDGFVFAGEQQAELVALERILRRYCLSRVARSGAPQAFCFLPAIPLGRNGKIQRKGLYALLEDVSASSAGDETGPPADGLLSAVFRAWTDVLGPGDYTTADNFFLLGGDSLTATMVVNRFASQFNVDLPVDSLFLFPTAAEQVQLLSRSVAGAVRPDAGQGQVSTATCLEQVLPVSGGQRRLWFLDRAGAGSEYNMSQPIWLHGRLDRAALEGAVNALRRRHGALRTTINALDGRPVQRIRPFSPEELEQVDLSGLTPARARARALALAAEYRNDAFDLAAGPLFRARLLRLDDDCHLLVLTIHHIVCDGWSMDLLRSELDTFYHAIVSGEPVDHQRGVPQYADYVSSVSADDGETSPGKQRLLQWWKQQLDDVDPVLQLPRRSGPNTSVGEGAEKSGARLHFDIPRSLVDRLETVAARHRTTLYAVLAASLGLLLHRYSGQQRFCVGTVSANRNDPDMEQVVGFFARTLPLPLDINGTDTLEALLDSTAAGIRGIFAHAGVEFDEIVQASGIARASEVTPLFQVMLAFQNLPRSFAHIPAAGSSDVPGRVEMESVVVDGDSAKYDLSLYLRPGDGAMKGIWQYRSDKIDASVVQSMNEDLATILDAFVDAPRSTMTDLPLHATGRTRASCENPEAKAGPCPPLLPHAFQRQAAAEPQRIALVSPSGELTYAELAGRVNRLANYLAARLAGRTGVIAVLLPRDECLVVASMAVMTTGSAFMPLEPGYPVQRLRDMIDTAGVDLLVVNRETRDLLSQLDLEGGALPPIVCLDDEADAIARCPVHPPAHAPSPDDVAYIIFTSGSTGKPKGVVLGQRNLAHYIQAMSGELGIVASDAYLYMASCAFSASVRQFALALANGARVVIATRESAENMASLLDIVSREGVTVLDLVPTLWRACHRWLSLPGQDRAADAFPRLRLLLSASEPLPVSLANKLRACWPRAELVNMYGQTETTGIVAVNRACGESGDTSVMPLGVPLPGGNIVLLDTRENPVTDGEVGEICVGGPCVGQGYLDGVGHASLPMARLDPPYRGTSFFYRTGDLGRLNEGGVIEFCGRIDTQIKHRGFRIEPGEIEMAALGYTGVTEAAAFLAQHPTRPGTEELQMAYCTAQGAGQEVDAQQLRSHLRDKLPRHMVPARLVELDAMPRTPAGKLDRTAIAASGARGDGPGARSAPGHDDGKLAAVTRALVSIWEDVLGCRDVGPHDNFFDLGGNSILSIEIVVAAMEAGLDLDLEQLFQYQTIAELAPVVVAGGSKAGEASHAPLEAPVKPPEAAPAGLARYSVESLRAFSLEALAHAGLASEGAGILTEVQLESSLRGQVTHNIGDIPRYAQRLAAGALNANPAMAMSDTSAISATLDGDNAPGQWVATVAMDKAVALARHSGAGLVSVRRSNHFGAAGHYAWRASQAGMIGLCFTNGPVVLAPTGGVTPLFGNNPIAIGLPCANGDPVVLDISMSVATRGKIGLAVAEGEPLQPGWILDELGIPSTQLQDLAAGLAVPIGGHKGYGLAFAIEALAGALSGAGYCRDHGRDACAGHGGSDIGHLFIAFDPALFMPSDRFQARLADIVAQAKSSELASDASEIFVPGEIEFRARRDNLRLGVPLTDSVVRRLIDYGRRHELRARIEPVAGT